MSGISSTLLKFLIELKENNDRDWFEENKPRYKKEESKFKTFCADVMEGLQKNDQIEKMKVFRIYKDVRFSKDKTPYKVNRSVGFTRDGEALRGGYHLSIEPGNSFMGGGFFMPESADLQRIRKEFEIDALEITSIINDKKFTKVYGNEFVAYNKLKTAPKGFSKEHPNIDLLRNKSFFFEHKFSDKEVLSEKFSDTVVANFEILRPFFNYMSDILTTDLNGVSLLKK